MHHAAFDPGSFRSNTNAPHLSAAFDPKCFRSNRSISYPTAAVDSKRFTSDISFPNLPAAVDANSFRSTGSCSHPRATTDSKYVKLHGMFFSRLFCSFLLLSVLSQKQWFPMGQICFYNTNDVFSSTFSYTKSGSL